MGVDDGTFVIDGLGMVHHVANYRRIYEMASPAMKRVLGPGAPIDMYRARVWLALDRWADDGGRAP